MSGVSQKIDRVEVVFDDELLVADAGLLAAATLVDRLGLEALVGGVVRLGGRPGWWGESGSYGVDVGGVDAGGGFSY